jgi:hypothetical protein
MVPGGQQLHHRERPAVKPHRLGEREARAGHLSSLTVRRKRALGSAAAFVLLGELTRHRLATTRRRELLGLGEPPVQQPAVGRAHPVVRRDPQEVVGEVVARADLA